MDQQYSPRHGYVNYYLKTPLFGIPNAVFFPKNGTFQNTYKSYFLNWHTFCRTCFNWGKFHQGNFQSVGETSVRGKARLQGKSLIGGNVSSGKRLVTDMTAEETFIGEKSVGERSDDPLKCNENHWHGLFCIRIWIWNLVRITTSKRSHHYDNLPTIFVLLYFLPFSLFRSWWLTKVTIVRS